MAIQRWDPFGELMRFRGAMDRIFEETFSGQPRLMGRMGSSLPMDVCEMNDEFVIRAAIPGIHPEHLDISVKEDRLTINGEITPPEWMQQQGSQGGGQAQGQQQQQQQQTTQGRGVTCWLQEIPYGRFTRSITLPTPVDAKRASAEFENGLLILRLPKTEEAKPRRIEVQAGGQRQQIGAGQGHAQGQMQEPGQRTGQR